MKNSTNDPEIVWLREVYQPDARQLTVRAVLAGMVIGMLMCLSNLYVILKTGWSLGVTVTACILAWALFHLLRAARVARAEFTMLENNAMGSVASAAGYMTGGGNMSALPALLMLTGARPDPVPMIAWFAVIAALGVFAAIPIKRQLVNIEQLAFPTGTATAETIKALHSHGGEAANKARLLGLSAVIGAAVAWLRDAKVSWLPFNLPHNFGLPFTIRGLAAAKWTLSIEGSLLLLGAGALMSFKTGWSLILGGVLTWGFLAPAMYDQGVIKEVTYKAMVQWTLWGGAAVLVSSGLLSFALQWKMVARSFAEMRFLFGGKKGDNADPMAEVECPPHWFPLGFLLLGPVIVYLMWSLFGIPWWAGVLALPLAILMGVVAARVTGETDVTPTKALGPVTQLIYGGVLPGNVTANVMSANVTGGVGLHAADLLTDLKSGFLLGAKPRQQFYAQLFGVLAGAAIVVPAFNLIVPSADILGGEVFPAPSAQVWAGVSKLLSVGLDSLAPSAKIAALIGFVLGAVLTLLERYAPKGVRPFVPSPSGIGISVVLPGSNVFMMGLGAIIAEVFRRKKGKKGDELVLPVSAGLIAGESLMGILVAMLIAFGVLSR